jgi:hypothetical protein
MGLRDIFRKHKKNHDTTPSASSTDKTKTHQQQKHDTSGIASVDMKVAL